MNRWVTRDLEKVRWEKVGPGGAPRFFFRSFCCLLDPLGGRHACSVFCAEWNVASTPHVRSAPFSAYIKVELLKRTRDLLSFSSDSAFVWRITCSTGGWLFCSSQLQDTERWIPKIRLLRTFCISSTCNCRLIRLAESIHFLFVLPKWFRYKVFEIELPH